MTATLNLMARRGYSGTSIEAVAERAHVAKTTIYRSWPNKASLVVDAFYAATEADLTFPDTGSAREDFRIQIEQLAALLRSPVGAAFVAMVGGAQTDPELGRALAERWVIPRRQWGIARLKRAVANGECEGDLDVEASLSTFYSPLYAPLLLGLGVPTAKTVDAYLAIVLRGVFKR